MSNPRKLLTALVRDRTFLARRHGDRLLEAPIERSDLRCLQNAYRNADNDGVRQAIAVAFERAVQTGAPDPRVLERRTELEAIINAPPEYYDPNENRAS